MGAPEHKAALLEELMTCDLMNKKGDQVALRRWFSWAEETPWNCRFWHSRLLFITALGIKLQVWPNREHSPLHQGARLSTKMKKDDDGDTEKEKDTHVEAGAAAAAASGAAGSGGPAKDEEDKGPVTEEEVNLQKLRRKAKNGLFLAGEILALDGMCRKVKAIFEAIQPLTDEHFGDAANVRGQAEVLSWYLKASQMSWLSILCKAWAGAQSPGTLRNAGFKLSFDSLPGDPGPLHPTSCA